MAAEINKEYIMFMDDHSKLCSMDTDTPVSIGRIQIHGYIIFPKRRYASIVMKKKSHTKTTNAVAA